MRPVSRRFKVVQSVLVVLMAVAPVAAGAQLYGGRPATQAPAAAQRPSTVAPAAAPPAQVPAAAATEGLVDDPSHDVIDQYLEASFQMVEPELRAGKIDAAIGRLMESGKRGGAKDLLAALQLRFAARNPRADMRADPVFVEAMQVLAHLSAARSLDAYFVAGVLYRGESWLPKDAERANQFMQAAAAGGVRAAAEMLRYPVR